MKNKFLKAVLGGLLLSLSSLANAGIIFTEDFSATSGGSHHNGQQFQSNLDLVVANEWAGWNRQGQSHGVDLNTLVSAPTDMAAMIWQGHTLTLASAISGSNVFGTQYDLSFLMSAAVYANGGQTTTSNGGMWVELLKNDNTVLKSEFFKPGAWTGTMAFSQANLQYTGDGSGDIRLQVRYSAENNRFSGAVDNLSLSSGAPTSVPEPSTLAIFALSMIGLASRRFKKQS
jgi:hypothetical protein